MNLKDLTLEKIVLELRYKRGYRYLDLCGQAINDLNEAFPDLDVVEASPNGSKLISRKSAMAIDFGSMLINITQDFPKSYQDFSEIAEKVVENLSSIFDIGSYTRAGNRFIFTKGLTNKEEGVDIMSKWNIFNFRENKTNKFGDALQLISTSFSLRLENEDVGRTIRAGLLSRNVDFEHPPFIQIKEVKLPPSEVLNIDIDFYTKKVIEKGVFDVTEFIKSNYKKTDQDLMSFLEGH